MSQNRTYKGYIILQSSTEIKTFKMERATMSMLLASPAPHGSVAAWLKIGGVLDASIYDGYRAKAGFLSILCYSGTLLGKPRSGLTS